MPSLPARDWLHHTPPAWVTDSTFFVTICFQTHGPNQLCTPSVAPKLLSAVEHYQQHLRWRASLWLLMPDHLHALISLPRDEALAATVSAWKRFTARDAGIVWQRGFFDHRLRSEENFEAKAAYIKMNPVRKNLVSRPEDWPHVWPKVRR